MRFKFNKKIEFFLKKNFLPQSYLFEKRIKRSIKNNDEKELHLLKKIIIPETDTIDVGVYRGVYSYEMAKYSKMVHAFEPNPIIFKDIDLWFQRISYVGELGWEIYIPTKQAELVYDQIIKFEEK